MYTFKSNSCDRNAKGFLGRKPTPEDFTIRDQSYTPTTAQDIYLDHLRGSKSPPYGYVRTFGKKIAKYPKGGKKAPVTKKAKKTLIYCEQGALYLPDETYTTFVKLAKRILINRRFPDAEITKFGVDVNRRGNAREDTQHQTFDTNDEGAKELYQTHIVPNFNKPDFLIRVRPLSIDWNREIDPKRSSTQIKLNHKDIGYVYIEAGWKILQDSEMNSEYFVGEAIRFLFPERSGILQFRLETTNHGSHDIDVSQPMRALTPEVQRIFAKLAGFGLSSPPVVDIVERSPPVVSEAPPRNPAFTLRA